MLVAATVALAAPGAGTAAVKNPKQQVTAHALTVTVTDAGDAVKGATMSVKGHTEKTNVHGVAKIKL